ncbi:MAG: outer membrane protein assembly factor BamD [Paludibacteraceae bacterium]|nr:outer membrane protein assembly factor BamD [Paludibacteraceae bacterium]
MKPFMIYIRRCLLLVLSLSLVACSNYQKLMKKASPEDKYAAAKDFLQEKDFMRASTLLEDVSSYYRGTGAAEDVLFFMAEAYMGQKDYYSAAEYYKAYMKNYPRGKFVKESRYMIAVCYYSDSPDARLDQSSTEKAIDAFSDYIEFYPTDSRVKDAYLHIAEMQDKLAYKGVLNAKLYFNLGIYLGNNYRSAILTAQNVLKDYPETKYREELSFLILNSKYKEAAYSASQKRKERYSEVIDEYYNYSNEFPDGKHINAANRIFKESKNILK